ncbi:MAG: alpha/beta fold hydrolase, partial [Leptothrix sp. (in: b-proteobacteria)]
MTAHTEGLQGLAATPERTRREHAVGALRWQVEVLGEGPTLLLLHGTGASAHSWRDIAPVLARSHRVVVPDLPGHRRSAPLPVHQRSLAGLAEALASLLRSLDRLDAPEALSTPTAHAPPRVAAVIGHSAGAALMVRMALDGALPGSQLIGLNAALLPFDGLARLVCAPLARLIADTPLLLPLVARLAASQAHKPAALRRLIASTGSTLDDTGIALYGRLMREPAHIAG